MGINTKKTVYDPVEPADGKRILVMRFWPRNVRKEKVDVWLKELGTDKELIKKWKAGKVTWTEFCREYKKSLKDNDGLIKELAKEAKHKTITLLCSCKDEEHCHRHLLKEAITSYEK